MYPVPGIVCIIYIFCNRYIFCARDNILCNILYQGYSVSDINPVPEIELYIHMNKLYIDIFRYIHLDNLDIYIMTK